MRGVRGVADCSAQGCGSKAFTRGMCNKHYLRWRKYGDATKVLSVQDRRPAEERWRYRYTVDPQTGCWLWDGRLNYGYGMISVGGVETYAHRFVYEQVIGPVPNETLDHLCHTNDPSCPGGDTCPHRRCINPEHLEPVTRVENIMRGRSPWVANAAKTHCEHGHEFTVENTIIRKDGNRDCRACGRKWQREYRARKKLKKAGL